jgi:hypothetical protein
VARLSGTGLLADDLYLLAHHDVSGRPFLHPRALGIGLAGALLAELVVFARIRVGTDSVMVVDSALPEDELAGHVLGLLLNEYERYPARDWLTFLAVNAEQEVARRLGQAGYLTQERSRRRWRADRWVPVNPDWAFSSLARARAVLDPARPAPAHCVVLAGLATACGLGSRLLQYGPSGARHCLDAAVRQLSTDLRELIAQTQAAVDSALLSQRV